jgi:hypothetical protein
VVVGSDTNMQDSREPVVMVPSGQAQNDKADQNANASVYTPPFLAIIAIVKMEHSNIRFRKLGGSCRQISFDVWGKQSIPIIIVSLEHLKAEHFVEGECCGLIALKKHVHIHCKIQTFSKTVDSWHKYQSKLQQSLHLYCAHTTNYTVLH